MDEIVNEKTTPERVPPTPSTTPLTAAPPAAAFAPSAAPPKSEGLRRSSDPGWLRGVAWGAFFTAAGATCSAGAMVLSCAATTRAMATLAWTLLGMAALALGFGVWLITLPERPVPTRRLAPLLARWTTLVSSLLLVIAPGLFITGHPSAAGWLLMAVLLLLSGASAAASRYLSGLAARLPNDGLAGQLCNQIWLLPSVLLAIALDQHSPWSALIDSLRSLIGYLHLMYHINLSAAAETVIWTASNLLTFIDSPFLSYPLLGAVAGIVLWTASNLLTLAIKLGWPFFAAERRGFDVIVDSAADKGPLGNKAPGT
jgi:hypothetical protein